MNDMKQFYDNLPKKSRLVLLVGAVVIILSITRVVLVVHHGGENRNPTVQKYIKQINSRDAKTKYDAIYLAGIYGVKETAPALEKIVKTDADVKMKKLAAWSLGKIDPAKLAALLDGTPADIRDIAMEELILLDKNNVSYLLERFQSSDTAVKMKILSYLSAANNPFFNDKAMTIAEKTEEDTGVRTAAFAILKETGTGDFEGRLNAIYYNDPDSAMKTMAKETLNAINSRGVKQ